MKFTIEPKLLKDELGFLNLAVDKTGNELTSHVLIESDGKKSLTVKATNLTTSIKTVIEADVKEEGSMCIQGKKLHDIVKVLEQEVSFSTEKNDWVNVKSGKSKFRIPGISVTQFPTISVLEDAEVKIHSNSLSKMIKSTAFSTSDEAARFTLLGIKFEILENSAKAVSTDGHRISIIEKKCGSIDKELREFLVHKECFTELMKLPKDKVVEIGQDENHIFFKVENKYITVRKLAGNFPHYTTMLNEDGNISAQINRTDLSNSVTKVSLMSDDKVPTINLLLSKGTLNISTQSDRGEGEDSIPLKYKGDDVEISLNWVYLQDFLNNCEVEDLELSFKDGTKPLLIKYEDYQYVLMPIRQR